MYALLFGLVPDASCRLMEKGISIALRAWLQDLVAVRSTSSKWGGGRSSCNCNPKP